METTSMSMKPLRIFVQSVAIITLGFLTKEEYYEYILESIHNGQHKQAKNLFNQLPNDGMTGERAQFFWWVEGNFESGLEKVTHLREYFNS